MALLTLIQQQAIKPITPNWAAALANNAVGSVTNFVQTEAEVEEKELRDLLGVALLQDLQDNPATAPNIALLNGSTFEDCNGNTIKTKGLRYVIAFMVHSQAVFSTSYSDTFTGYTNKNRQETQDTSKGDKKEIKGRSRALALQEFELIKDFLNENSTIYPLWICNISKKPYTPKFTGVKRTIK